MPARPKAHGVGTRHPTPEWISQTVNDLLAWIDRNATNGETVKWHIGWFGEHFPQFGAGVEIVDAPAR